MPLDFYWAGLSTDKFLAAAAEVTQSCPIPGHVAVTCKAMLALIPLLDARLCNKSFVVKSFISKASRVGVGLSGALLGVLCLPRSLVRPRRLQIIYSRIHHIYVMAELTAAKQWKAKLLADLAAADEVVAKLEANEAARRQITGDECIGRILEVVGTPSTTVTVFVPCSGTPTLEWCPTTIGPFVPMSDADRAAASLSPGFTRLLTSGVLLGDRARVNYHQDADANMLCVVWFQVAPDGDWDPVRRFAEWWKTSAGRSPSVFILEEVRNTVLSVGGAGTAFL